jgi:ABC-2 type transport system ATP-binding protein
MIIEIEHLTKKFGKFVAVNDVSLAIREGEIVALLGPNGAGKTTTIHMVMGLISQTSGAVRIFGHPIETHREEILQQMNFTSPYVAFPVRLTFLENLMVFAVMYGIRNPRERILEMLRLFEIEDKRDKPVSRLSSGETTRVGLCKAFMNDPKLLLLDEPTAYLDPTGATTVKNILLTMNREHGTTILYTSHNMAEVEEMCRRIVFLNHGRVIADGSPIDVTKAILKEERDEPSLHEVFLQVAREKAA